MGSTVLVIFTCLILALDRGFALKCYSCFDIYNRVEESDKNCRDNIGALEAKECQAKPNEAPEGSTPRCFKVLGTVVATSNQTGTVREKDIQRDCLWVPPDSSADQCVTAQDGKPLDEFKGNVDGVSYVQDIDTICVCNTDACNGVGSLQPFALPLVLVVIVGCGIRGAINAE